MYRNHPRVTPTFLVKMWPSKGILPPSPCTMLRKGWHISGGVVYQGLAHQWGVACQCGGVWHIPGGLTLILTWFMAGRGVNVSSSLNHSLQYYFGPFSKAAKWPSIGPKVGVCVICECVFCVGDCGTSTTYNSVHMNFPWFDVRIPSNGKEDWAQEELSCMTSSPIDFYPRQHCPT